MANEDEVFEKVKDVLVEALGVDKDEINREARLVNDLGAESIDFLDIIFQLEKAFSIKIEQKEFSQNAQSEGGEDSDITVEAVVRFVMSKVV